MVFQRWNGQARGLVVKKLSVYSPPLFGVAWKLREFGSQFLFVVIESFRECSVGVFLSVCVVWLSLCSVFLCEGSLAGFVEPWV